MADLHRAGRYDRMSNDVLTLTGQGPLSVQEFVRKNAATFTASAKKTRLNGSTKDERLDEVPRYGDVSILLKGASENHSVS
jgi:hypothetical protein